MKNHPVLLWLFVLLGGMAIPSDLSAQKPPADQARELGRMLWSLCRAGRTDDIVSQPFSDLINRGADLNYQDPEDGTTALMWCARLGNLTEYNTLVTKGASPYAKATRMVTDRTSEPAYMGTVLTAAVQGGNYSLIRHLVETARVPVNETGPGNGGLEGPTPLLIASMLGQLNVVLLLLNNNAAINKPSAADNLVTPLMAAAASGQEDVCEYLLKMGANPFQKDRKGRTAKDWATQNEQPKLAQLVQKYVDKTAIPNPVTDWYQAGLSLYSSQFRFDNLEQTGWAYEQAGRSAEAQLYYIKAAQSLYNAAQAEETVANPAFPLRNLYHFPFAPNDWRVTKALSGFIQAEQQVNARTWYFLSLMSTMKLNGEGLMQRPLTIHTPSMESLASLTRQLRSTSPTDPLLTDLAYLNQYFTTDAKEGGREERRFYNRVLGSNGRKMALEAASERSGVPAGAVQYITLLIDNARDHLSRQDTATARQYIQQALTLGTRRLAATDPLQASLLSSAGDCYRRIGTLVAFRESEALYKREQTHLQTNSPTDTLARIRNLLGFANLYADWNRNSPAKAQQYLQQALAIASPASNLPIEVWLALYGQLADLDGRSGKWSAVANHYAHLLDQLRQQRKMNHPIVAIVLYNTGCAYRELGNWSAAVDFFNKANQHARQFGQLMSGNLYLFAKAYEANYRTLVHQGLWDAFNTLSNTTATDLDNTTNKPWLYDETRYGWLLTTQQVIESLPGAKKLAAIETKLRAPVRMLEQPENISPFTIQAMLALARTYQSIKEQPKADSLYEHAVVMTLSQWGRKSPVYWRASLQQAQSWIDQRKNETQAEAQLRQLCALMRAKHIQVQPYLPAALARLYQQETESLFSGLVQAAWRLNKPNSALMTDLFEFSVQIRTYQLNPIERLSEIWRRKDDTLDEWLERLQGYKSAYQQDVQNRNPTPDEQRSLASTIQDMTVTEEGVRRILLDLHKKTPLSSFRTNSYQKKLTKQEAFIQFIRATNDSTTQADYFALVIRSDGQPPHLIRLIDELSLIQAIPANAGDYAALPTIDKCYRQLFQYLWKPMAGHLTGISQIQYSSAGLVHRISLPGLIDEQGISLANHLTWLGRFSPDPMFETKSSPTRPRFVIYGDIAFEPENNQTGVKTKQNDIDQITTVYRSYKSGPWLPLSGTRQEVSAIDDLIRKKGFSASVRTGYAASERQLAIDVATNESTILHVATHGFYLGYNPGDTQFFGRTSDPLLRAGIVLAGANGVWLGTNAVSPGRDGILTALELSALPMSHVHLTTLSACETGLGEIQGTESIVGMARALKMAGVNYILVSLWPVPDEITKELMTEFYQEFLQHLNPEEALRTAQRKLAPKYTTGQWAGFVLMR